jgi:hypothetical protein
MTISNPDPGNENLGTGAADPRSISGRLQGPPDLAGGQRPARDGRRIETNVPAGEGRRGAGRAARLASPPPPSDRNPACSLRRFRLISRRDFLPRRRTLGQRCVRRLGWGIPFVIWGDVLLDSLFSTESCWALQIRDAS